MTNAQQLSKSARKTINAQITARQAELQTCKTAAALSCVLRDIERLQGILARGSWI